MRIRPITLAAVYSFASAVPAFADQAQGPFYGPHMGNAPWHGWFLGPIMMIFLVVIAVAIVLLLTRWFSVPGRQDGPNAGNSPLDTLKERFARGEIDAQEFEDRKRVLTD